MALFSEAGKGLGHLNEVPRSPCVPNVSIKTKKRTEEKRRGERQEM